MPRYDIRNDGAGPYAIFYCDTCGREFRSQPDIGSVVTKDIGRSAVSGFLRKVPLVGSSVADSVVGEDPRYSYKMTPAQVETAWKQTQVHFRECPTCNRIVCLSDFDTQSGFCQEDSPRTSEIAEARGQTAAQLALAWTMAHPAITAAVMGASSVAQLESNLPAFDLEMTPEQRQELTQTIIDAEASAK